MFGGLAFLLAGHLVIAVSHEGGILLRCDPAEMDELLAKPHARPAVMRGRELAGWLRVAPEGIRTRPQLERWLARAVRRARSLPAKRS